MRAREKESGRKKKKTATLRDKASLSARLWDLDLNLHWFSPPDCQPEGPRLKPRRTLVGASSPPESGDKLLKKELDFGSGTASTNHIKVPLLAAKPLGPSLSPQPQSLAAGLCLREDAAQLQPRCN